MNKSIIPMLLFATLFLPSCGKLQNNKYIDNANRITSNQSHTYEHYKANEAYKARERRQYSRRSRYNRIDEANIKQGNLLTEKVNKYGNIEYRVIKNIPKTIDVNHLEILSINIRKGERVRRYIELYKAGQFIKTEINNIHN